MMVSDEEKRWVVVGIAMNKVAAPVLRDYIKQGIDTHYLNLDIYCSGLTTPCTLKTLTYHHVSTNPAFKHLKFKNVNNNLQLHGKHKNLYNYNVNSSVDLAKSFLPDYLANFSAFDESLDMSAILRLLAFNNPAPIFLSPNPLISIQMSADDVRENVRNKWGHCNVTDWTEVLFNDCFSKLETLVRSLGLTGGMEKTTLDRLSDWKTKGCQLCMGHAVDQNLLSLVQQDVQELIKKIKKTEVEQSVIQGAVAEQRTEQTEMQNSVALLQDQQSLTKFQLEELDEELKAVLEWKEQLVKEKEIILEKLVSLEKALSEELVARVRAVEDDLSEVKTHISQTDESLKQLKENVRDDVSQVKAQIFQTDERVKELEENVRYQKMKYDRPANSALESFDVKTCRSKLAEHYKRTATVPTSVWSKTSPTDIHQIYTRLSWVKEEQTPAGSSRSELRHYTDVFTAHKDGVLPKRILVDGQTGIGKSTFVKKLSVDWAELDDEKKVVKQKDVLKGVGDDGDVNKSVQETRQDYKDMQLKQDGKDRSSIEREDTTSDDKYEDMSELQKKALKNFELVLVINLKEVSKCQSLKEVLCGCSFLPEEEATMAEELLSYITKNQEKVLLVFDGYDEYRCGSNSEIYDIFRGKKLRDCCVLVTSRISKADELREFKDVHAKITGFSKKDRNTFMNRMLGGEAEANGLRWHLDKKRLTDLARVPLLLLFFCTLWRKGKSCSFPETKTKLYLTIVQYILDYSEGKSASPCFGKVQDFEEILSEIGKVALECLLKDDHVFEYDQLSNAVLSDKSRIIGLLQVTEYAENLRPAGMVSFIHKSIQEFLAAWYITYRCVPKGDLCGIEEHARKLENCDTLNTSIALENVFHFICGLSEDGAVKVFQHLASVRISDPTLDLSKIIPNVENETGEPLCDVTMRHERFSDLVYDSFREVSSKAVFLSHYFDCTGGIVLVSKERSVSGLMQNVNVLTELARNCVFRFSSIPLGVHKASIVYQSLEFLDCLQMPLTIPESSKVLTVRDLFVRKVGDIWTVFCRSFFSSMLCFSNGQFQLYITELDLNCDDHARLFTESSDSTPSVTASLCSEQSCLKFLSSLGCYKLSGQTMKALGAVIRNCKHLNSIEVQESDDSLCDFLEQVPNPSKCSLTIGPSKIRHGGSVRLTSAGAVQLASLLPRFNIITLDLELTDCFSQAVDKLATSITHKALERLVLTGISLTPAAAVALGRSLPEISSLQELELTGLNGNILQAEDMEALFSGFNMTLPLYKLTFSNFNVRGRLAPLAKSFRFFPSLMELKLEKLNIDEHDHCFLLESFRFFGSVTALSIRGEQKGPAHCYTTKSNNEESLNLDGITLTPAAAVALGRSLPEMSSLQTLELTGVDGSILQVEEMEALFGGIGKSLPLRELIISGFSVRGSLDPLIKNLCFFPVLRKLKLALLNMDEHDQCGLLDSLRSISNITALTIQSKPVGQTDHCTAGLTLTTSYSYAFPRITSKSCDLTLDGMWLTPAAAVVLGQSLPKMSSLRSLSLTAARNGSILQAVDLDALFGKLNRPLPLYDLTFCGFSVRCSIAALTNSLCFFPNLMLLKLTGLAVDEHNLCCLLGSLRFVPNLMELVVWGESVSYQHSYNAKVHTVDGFAHKALKELVLSSISLTPVSAAALGRSLSEMLALEELFLDGGRGSILQVEEMEALFGGFSKMLPLRSLSFRYFSVKVCLAPLTKSFRYFPNLRELNLGGYDEEINVNEHSLCCLLESLRFIPNLRTLRVKGKPLSQKHCCTSEVNTTASIAHNNLEQLELDGINLTSAVATVLGRSLPEMPSLQVFELTGVSGSIVQADEMEALFGGFNKTLPLYKLTFCGFEMRGCLAALTKSFCFFPNLRELCFGQLNVDENDVCSLLENLQFMPKLRALSIRADHLGQARCYATESHNYASLSHRVNDKLNLDGISLTLAVAAALGRSLPEMSSLQELELSGGHGSILQVEEMKAMFGAFNKTVPLTTLIFSDFMVTGCLEPLTKSFRFFPNLRELKLERLNVNESDQCALLENFGLFRDLTQLSVQRNDQDSFRFHYHTSEVNTFFSSTRDQVNKRLDLDGITLTPAVVAALGRLIPEMSSLKAFELSGVEGSILKAEEMRAIFGRFNKALPVDIVTFSDFSVRGCLAPFSNMLQFFPNLRILILENLDMDEDDFCSLLNAHWRTAEVNAVASTQSTTHNTLEKLVLNGINLTPAVAKALGRSLPEMSSLEELELTGVNGSILKTKEMEALFGGFKETMLLRELTFNGFSVRGCLAPLIKSVQFFPSLTYLNLENLNMDEHDLSDLLACFQCFPHLSMLNLSHNPLGHAVRSIVPYIINLQKLRHLWIDQTGPEEDLKYVRDTVQEAIPELSTNSPRCNVM